MPPDYTESSRRISLVRLAIVILVVVGLGVLIWAIFFHQSNQPTARNDNHPSTSSQTQHNSSPSTTGNTGSGNSKSNPSTNPSGANAGSNTPKTSDSSTSNDKKQPATSGSSSASSSQAPQQLSNTGPGDVVGLFIGATAVGVVVFQTYLRRRMSVPE